MPGTGLDSFIENNFDETLSVSAPFYLSGLCCHRQRFLQLPSPSIEAIAQQWLAKLKKLGNVENFKCIISDHFTFLGDDLGNQQKAAEVAARLKGFCSLGTLSLIKTCMES